MKTLDLNFYQRVLLWNLVGSGSVGSLKEAAPCLRLLDKIRLSDEETRITDFRPSPQGLSWQLPMAEYGCRTVELEGDEVTALLAQVENMKSVPVADAAWLLKLVDELKAEPKEGGEGAQQQTAPAPAPPTPPAPKPNGGARKAN